MSELIHTYKTDTGEYPVYRDDKGIEYCKVPEITPEQRMLDAGVPDKYVYPDIEYDDLVGIDRIRLALESWNWNKWLAFVGPVGTGKTTLMREIAYKTTKAKLAGILNRARKPLISRSMRYSWVSYPSLVKKLQQRWDDKTETESEFKLMRETKEPALLFLDDLGKGSTDSGFYQSLAFDIIDWRYRENLVLVFTTDLTKDSTCFLCMKENTWNQGMCKSCKERRVPSLRESIGNAAASRLVEMSTIINLQYQPDFREIRQRKG